MKTRLFFLFALTLFGFPLFGKDHAPGGNEKSVKLIYAECKIFYHKALLLWSTEYEKVSCEFIIESTVDGKDWCIKGRVSSQGRGDRISEYSWEGERDEKITSYRIRQLDPLGSSVLTEVLPENYSITVSIQQIDIDQERKLIMEYSIDKDQEIIVRVFNNIGEQVLTRVMPFDKAGEFIYSLDVSDFSTGNYLLQVDQVLLDKTVAEKSFSLE